MSLDQSVQAVIFTHCARLKYEDEASFRANQDNYIDAYKKSFKSFLLCNKDKVIVTDVFAYVDQGVKDQITQLASHDFVLAPDIQSKEQKLKSLLARAEREALEDMKREALEDMKPDISKPPKFHYVGLQELTYLLNLLWKVDPTLLKEGIFLGKDNTFTYDSPKFVEAVIRLARGDIPRLAKDPIIRIDDDAKINAKSIEILLEKFTKLSRNKPFYFFSGRYGREDVKLDIVNDFAVRTHWFFPAGTVAGDDRFINPDHEFHAGMKAAEIFLCDLQVLGARQPLLPESQNSKNLENARREGRLKNIKPRTSPQVISGAGLIMARRNIALLPPFINSNDLIIWIDDYLKRELHEMLGDIAEPDTQCIEEAKFEQDRHFKSITEDDINSINSEETFLSKKDYLKRLLLGCMFSAIIGDKSETNYADIIKDIVVYKLGQDDFNANKKDKLQKQILWVAFEHYALVLDCWSSEEYKGYKSYDWANRLLTDLNTLNLTEDSITIDNAPPPVKDVVVDAMNYLNLVFNWHKFTRAIERLEICGNDWLYES